MPKISVIIPHIPSRHLRALGSLEKQTFRDFETIPVIDNVGCMSGKPRNLGAKVAKGEYLFFCDDDLELYPNCLERMVDELDKNNADFVYCDYERCGTLAGIQHGKPWNYSELIKTNYISTMSMIRKKVFDQYLFDETLPRYVDWDLWLRIGKRHNGYYIPEVLFNAYFSEDGISSKGNVDRITATHRIWIKHKIYPPKNLTVIVPFRKNIPMLSNCIEALEKHSCCLAQLIIVDDSNHGEVLTTEWSTKLPLCVRNQKRSWHSGSCNNGFELCQTEYVCFLNSDTMVGPEWDARLILAFSSAKEASCIGPMTSHASSVQQVSELAHHTDKIILDDIPTLARFVQNRYPMQTLYALVNGFCFLTRAEIFRNVGMFDEKFLGGGDEYDWISRAMDAGMCPVVHTHAYVHHIGQQSYTDSERSRIWSQGRDRFIKKHGADRLAELEGKYFQRINLRRL